MNGSTKTIRRFYQSVSVSSANEGYEVRLDDKPLRTKGQKVLIAPSASLADAIQEEWKQQGDEIDLASTPLTNLLADAIDADASNASAMDQWRADILGYLGSDLVCYRADAPQALVERQADVWGHYLDWLRDDLGAALVVTTGVISTPQPQIAIDRVRTVLAPLNRETLAALRKATAITGSAVMALALWKQAFAARDVFAASVIDEVFQAEQWGEDEEAMGRRQTIEREFLHIARFLELLGSD